MVHKLIRRSDAILNIDFSGMSKLFHSFQITPSTAKDLALSFPPNTGRPSTSSVFLVFLPRSHPGTNAEDSFQQFLKAYRKHDFNLRYLTVMQNHLSLPNINHFFETLKKTQIPTLQTLTLGPFSLILLILRRVSHRFGAGRAAGHQPNARADQSEETRLAEYAARLSAL